MDKTLRSDLISLARRFHEEAVRRDNKGRIGEVQALDEFYRKLMLMARQMQEAGLP